MKALLVSFLVLMGSIMITAPLAAQDTIPALPCRQTKVSTDTTKIRILNEFITASVINNYFINDKGIIQLNIYKNKEGLTCWLLLPRIDDRYKDNPPPTFEEFRGDIILIYPADANGNELKTPNPEPLNKCLEAVIGDRVYPRPTKKGRWGTPYTIPGINRVLNQGLHRMSTGNSGDLIIIFQKDGTYKTLKPV
jgi:hypothetical protein